MSNQLVEKINSDIMEKLQFNQWRNTNAVLKWYNNITNKSLFSLTIKNFTRQ